ncbi:MAG: DUF4430 domain-containing protein [Candidatus Nanohaloarchaea archaeon]|nr:DUF4430 domain-containing protein [Candidatus Nanohaloarchaea archaeon]
MTVSLTIATPTGNTSETLQVSNTTTAFEAVNRSHRVEYSTYSSGIFITGIDGVMQNDTHSWMYLVNGEPPSTGADSYTLEDGDNLTFWYMSNKRAMNLVG